MRNVVLSASPLPAPPLPFTLFRRPKLLAVLQPLRLQPCEPTRPVARAGYAGYARFMRLQEKIDCNVYRTEIMRKLVAG